jgi:hypothetical protein
MLTKFSHVKCYQINGVRPLELDNVIFFVNIDVDSTMYGYFEQY